MSERTFVLVKPDGVQRGLVGEVLRRYESRGLKVVALKLLQIPRALAEEHYSEHRGKPFFEGLVSYITSAPVVAMVLEGPRAVDVVRTINGATRPSEALPGTIRGDLALDISRNVVHGSDSLESAQREISLFFTKDEILTYSREVDRWIEG